MFLVDSVKAKRKNFNYTGSCKKQLYIQFPQA